MKNILVLNGPNLNLLGTRQPETYGNTTLQDVEDNCAKTAAELGVEITFQQSNHEGVLIDAIQNAASDFDGIVMNAGGFTHTSVAIMDAIGSVDTPVLELHVSNIHRREEFRQHSYLSKVCIGMISGLGVNGYPLAIRAMHAYLNDQNPG